MFSRKRHWISWTRFRLDPTRSDLDLGLGEPNFHIAHAARDLTPYESGDAPCWALFIS